MTTPSPDQFYLEKWSVGFKPSQADVVIDEYVCAVCYGRLFPVNIPNSRTVIVACVEHGNVEVCGRVTQATVSINAERSFREYHEVIQNLKDLWGHLIKYELDYAEARRIAQFYTCKCGGVLGMKKVSGPNEPEVVACPKCNCETPRFFFENVINVESRKHCATCAGITIVAANWFTYSYTVSCLKCRDQKVVHLLGDCPQCNVRLEVRNGKTTYRLYCLKCKNDIQESGYKPIEKGEK